MAEANKKYDLEDRTFEFALNCRNLILKVSKNLVNIEYGKQLVRSSGSQAANYIEANEALSKKDFKHRIKICRKEAKETKLWLKLLDLNGAVTLEQERDQLVSESIEIMKIFGAILLKSK